MRRIGSAEEEASKRKRNQIIVGIVLIVVMLFSVLGYSFQGGDSSTKDKKIIYNGFEFIEQNNFWLSSIGNIQFSFKYNPKQVEKISSDIKTLDNYYNKPLYISSENIEAESEVYRNLVQVVQRVQEACLENEKCTGDLPYKTCKDNLIVIKESGSNSIRQEDNCVFIDGKKDDLVKLADEFLFKILDVE